MAPVGRIIGAAGSVSETAGSNPYAKDFDRTCFDGLEAGDMGVGAKGIPPFDRRLLDRESWTGASGEGGMTRNESRTLHCSLTPLVAKSGVAPLGMASENPIRAESSVIS